MHGRVSFPSTYRRPRFRNWFSVYILLPSPTTRVEFDPRPAAARPRLAAAAAAHPQVRIFLITDTGLRFVSRIVRDTRRAFFNNAETQKERLGEEKKQNATRVQRKSVVRPAETNNGRADRRRSFETLAPQTCPEPPVVTDRPFRIRWIAAVGNNTSGEKKTHFFRRFRRRFRNGFRVVVVVVVVVAVSRQSRRDGFSVIWQTRKKKNTTDEITIDKTTVNVKRKSIVGFARIAKRRLINRDNNEKRIKNYRPYTRARDGIGKKSALFFTNDRSVKNL